MSSPDLDLQCNFPSDIISQDYGIFLPSSAPHAWSSSYGHLSTNHPNKSPALARAGGTGCAYLSLPGAWC